MLDRLVHNAEVVSQRHLSGIVRRRTEQPLVSAFVFVWRTDHPCQVSILRYDKQRTDKEIRVKCERTNNFLAKYICLRSIISHDNVPYLQKVIIIISTLP